MPIMPTYDEQPERFIRAGTHFERCWRVHGECAIAQASAFESQIETLKRELDNARDENGILRREVLSVSQANERICLQRDELKENQERAQQTIVALGLEILKQSAVFDVARKEIARLEQLIRDYYTVEKFPTDQFIRLALGDDEARKLGIVIDVAEETRVALENGWIET